MPTPQTVGDQGRRRIKNMGERDEWKYWRDRIRNTKDDELESVYIEFYDSFKLAPPVGNYYNHQTEKFTMPKICLKDEILSGMILEKQVKSVLEIGFWDLKLIVNLGLRGIPRVDGVDCLKSAIVAANMGIENFPTEFKNRFHFYHTLAEDLTGLPKYDVVVNICLEHCRDPQRVITENLKYVNPGGYYYLTTPWKRGCDSQDHLWHWMTDDDLGKYFPDHLNPVFIKVRFSEKSSKLNYYIVSVRV